ncbi:hypothetical protein [Bacteroides oleiciplenus]|nr:hypothetical protein [Bacteroides oleiciplenus]
MLLILEKPDLNLIGKLQAFLIGGLRKQMSLEEQRYLLVINTLGGNKVWMSRNNTLGNPLSAIGELGDNHREFRNKLIEFFTTVIYNENGHVSKSLDIIIKDPQIALQQMESESKANSINNRLGELNSEVKSLKLLLKEMLLFKMR